MLNFKKIEENDVELIREYLAAQPYRLCDYSIGTLYIWKDYYSTEFCIYEEYLLIKFKDFYGNCVFAFPISKDINPLTVEEAFRIPKLREVVYAIKKGTEENNCQCVFSNITEELTHVLKGYFPECTIIKDRDWSDYLYNYEEFSQLKGRKYSSKRNHISRFTRDYPNYSFREIDESNIERVKAFYENVYLKEHSLEGTDEMEHIEAESTRKALQNFFLLKSKGGFVEVSGEIAGFTIGEIVRDTLIVHIEKALTRYNGIYSVIAREFAVMNEQEGLLYVNREEDAGDEGLRKSKLSYHPARLLDKHVVKI